MTISWLNIWLRLHSKTMKNGNFHHDLQKCLHYFKGCSGLTDHYIYPVQSLKKQITWSWYEVEGKVNYRDKKKRFAVWGEGDFCDGSFVSLHADRRGHTKSQGSAHTRRGELISASTLLTAELVTVCLFVAQLPLSQVLPSQALKPGYPGDTGSWGIILLIGFLY